MMMLFLPMKVGLLALKPMFENQFLALL